jgi:hypothetical protein
MPIGNKFDLAFLSQKQETNFLAYRKVILFKKFSSHWELPRTINQGINKYKFGVPIFQKLGGLFLGGLTFHHSE